MAERWLPVVGFKGFYEVSSLGRVRSVARFVRSRDNRQRPVRARILKSAITANYLVVGLHREGKQTMMRVHVAVLEAFVGPRPPGMVARHYPDRTPTNVAASNLSWASYITNNRDRREHGTEADNRGERSPNAKLTNAAVRRIRVLARRGVYQRDIAAKVGCSPSNVSRILQGDGWTNVL